MRNTILLFLIFSIYTRQFSYLPLVYFRTGTCCWVSGQHRDIKYYTQSLFATLRHCTCGQLETCAILYLITNKIYIIVCTGTYILFNIVVAINISGAVTTWWVNVRTAWRSATVWRAYVFGFAELPGGSAAVYPLPPPPIPTPSVPHDQPLTGCRSTTPNPPHPPGHETASGRRRRRRSFSFFLHATSQHIIYYIYTRICVHRRLGQAAV